jgi:hypothetical protein
VTDQHLVTGGCSCGALRYEADGAPQFAGYCFCADCRKASGSGYLPFMRYPAAALRFSGEAAQHKLTHGDGREAVRNCCAACGGLVFGGVPGRDEHHVVFAGSLDDPADFRPMMAICNGVRPDWALLPPGLKVFERMPG